MHIAYVTTDFVDNGNRTTGLPKYLLRVSLGLLEKGHKVTVITRSNRNVVYDYRGIEVHRVRVPKTKCGDSDKLRVRMRDYTTADYLYKELVRVIENGQKIDIVQYANLSALSIFHNIDIPAVLRLSSYSKMWNHDTTEAVKEESRLQRKAAGKCTAVFAPSYVVAKEFAKDIHRDVGVIETPFVMESEDEDLELYNALLKDKRYILFYGSFVKYKGIVTIAEMAYDYLNKYRNNYLVLFGDGNKDLVANVKRNAAEYRDRVIIHSAVGFDSLKPIIKHADAILLPSLMENFSNACVESMALKKIVIGTRGASFDQLIVDGENGFLCEIGDSESLMNSVNRALSLAGEEKKNIEMSAGETVKRLEPDKVIDQLVDFYERVINNHSRLMEKQ